MTEPTPQEIEWGTPRQTSPGRKSKFVPLLNEVREMNTREPTTWGVVARYTNPNTASSTTSTLRKRYPEYDFVAENREDEGVWFIWARIGIEPGVEDG